MDFPFLNDSWFLVNNNDNSSKAPPSPGQYADRRPGRDEDKIRIEILRKVLLQLSFTKDNKKLIKKGSYNGLISVK